MALKSDTEFVFTAACIQDASQERWYHHVQRDTQCCLLFGQRNEGLDLYNRDYHEDIAKSEITRRYLGTNFIILPFTNTLKTAPWSGCDTTSGFLIATNSVDTTCRVALDNANRQPVTVVRDGVIEYTDGLSIRDTCGLPEKFVVGCESCPTKNVDGLPNVCALIQIATLAEDSISGKSSIPFFNIEEYIKATTYWKTTIGRFYAIGPALTSSRVTGRAARAIIKHDFNRVNENYDMRKRGAEERLRRQAYSLKVCTQCSMYMPCYAEGGDVRCRGYYPPTDTLAGEILRAVHNPFTEFQMRTLLHNSGLFARYYLRRKCYGTLKVNASTSRLEFVLMSKLRPKVLTATQNYKEAISWITKYHGNPEFPSEFPRFKKQEKAALLELASHTWSPRMYNNWRATEYPLWCITQEPNGDFGTTYAWSNGRYTLPWSVRVHNLEDVYRNYKHFNYVDQIQHPLAFAYKPPPSPIT